MPASPIPTERELEILKILSDQGQASIRDAYIPRPCGRRNQTTRPITSWFVHHVFGGAIEQLVESVFSHRAPTEEELGHLESLLADARSAWMRRARSERRRP